MDSDMLVDVGENDSDDESAVAIEHLIPPDENVRKNQYGSIVHEEDDEVEESGAGEENVEGSSSARSSVSLSCKCRNTCSRKKNRRSPGCPCKNANKKCGANCTCGTSRLQCRNGKQQSIETENAQRLPSSAFERHREDIAKATEEIKTFVNELSAEKKEELLVKLLAQGKGSLDFARNMLEETMENGDEQDDGELSEIQQGPPEWCHCGQCVARENPDERKCCKLRNCISSYKLFENLCLDRNVMETAIKARCDIRADELDFGMNSYRKASYRQYILWRYGRLGKGNRRVCPSCAVRMVRAAYPAPDGKYMGFRSS